MYTSFKNFVKDWEDPFHLFEISTSGSTGKPKSILLSRDKMKYSVGLTEIAIPGIVEQPMLCCLPTDKMGGFMQMVRALLWNQTIDIIEPTSNPMSGLPKEHCYENISISPLQLATIIMDSASWDKLLRFKTILIGGAAIAERWAETITKSGHIGFYGTYGMTETYGHVALRNFPDKYYKPIQGVHFRINAEGVLSLNSELTEGKWLKTQDVVRGEAMGFEVVGRLGNVINTGGVKIQAEQIEQFLASHIASAFYISSKSNDVLGEEIVLIVDSVQGLNITELNKLIEEHISKYARIRHVVENSIQVDAVTGKIKRINLD